MMARMKRTLLPALAAAALLAGGCATPPAAEPIDFRETIQTAEKAVFPALVYIRVVCKDLSSGKDEKGVVSGSGVVITPEGELLTNHHVIDKAEEIRCLLTDGSSYPATVVGFDQDLDVALLKLERQRKRYRQSFQFAYAHCKTPTLNVACKTARTAAFTAFV